jgi:hypothetical protein
MGRKVDAVGLALDLERILAIVVKGTPVARDNFESSMLHSVIKRLNTLFSLCAGGVESFMLPSSLPFEFNPFACTVFQPLTILTHLRTNFDSDLVWLEHYLF